MFHFPYRAPASFATCQSDSISSTFAMFRKVIFIKFFGPPANAISLFENRHFLSHRPPIKIQKLANVGQFYFNKTAIFYKVAPRNSLCR